MGQQKLVGQALLVIEVSQSHTTFGRTPLDEGLAGRRDLYLTMHDTHERVTFMPRQDSNHNPSKRAAADSRLRHRGHRDLLINRSEM
jgi:hypothetical protein